jgi:hypothetical protein
MPGLFAPADKGSRFYVRQESVPTGMHVAPRRKAAISTPEHPPPQAKIDLCRQADRVMTERYGPPRVIVDTNLDVVAYGNERTLFAPDIPNEKLMELAKNAQPAALRDAIRTAARTGQSAEAAPVTMKSITSGEISIKVTPLSARDSRMPTDIVLAQDNVLCANQFGLRAEVLAKKHAIANLDIRGHQFAAFQHLAMAYGYDLTFLRFLLCGIGDEDTVAGALFPDPFHYDSVVQGSNIHEPVSLHWLSNWNSRHRDGQLVLIAW